MPGVSLVVHMLVLLVDNERQSLSNGIPNVLSKASLPVAAPTNSKASNHIEHVHANMVVIMHGSGDKAAANEYGIIPPSLKELADRKEIYPQPKLLELPEGLPVGSERQLDQAGKNDHPLPPCRCFFH
jgi:hypothetical protein